MGGKSLLAMTLANIVARMEPTGRANARPMTGSAKSGTHATPPRIALRSIRATAAPLVPRMLRSAPHLRCGALPGSIVPLDLLWVPALRSSAKGAAPRPGHERNLLSPPCCDLPVGRFVDRGVESPLQTQEREGNR